MAGITAVPTIRKSRELEFPCALRLLTDVLVEIGKRLRTSTTSSDESKECPDSRGGDTLAPGRAPSTVPIARQDTE